MNDEYIEWETTSGFLTPSEFVAWRGLLGTILGALFLLFVYIYFGIPINRIPMDLLRSAELSFFSFPAFIIAGILTISSTFLYLNIVKVSPLYFSYVQVFTNVLTMILGLLIYRDPIIGPMLSVPLFITSAITYMLYSKVEELWSLFKKELEQKVSPPVKAAIEYPSWLDKILKRLKDWFEALEQHRCKPLYIWALLCIILDSLRYFVIREVLGSIPEQEIFIVAINFRTIYFSLFCFFALLFIPMAYRNQLRRDIQIFNIIRKNSTKIAVLLVTSFTFVCSFALSTAAYGKSLFMSPLLFCVTTFLSIPLLSAWYFIRATRPHFVQRVSQVFGKIKPEQEVNIKFMLMFIISLALCISWVVYWYLTLWWNNI